SFTEPNCIRCICNLFMRQFLTWFGNWDRRPQILAPKQVIQPSSVNIIQRHSRLTTIVDTLGKSALTVALRENLHQIDQDVAVICGHWQLEPGQPLLQRCCVDFVALGVCGAHYGNYVIPIGESLTRVVESWLTLKYQVDFNQTGSLRLAIFSFAKV